ncbi:MAG: primosomal protein N' [Bacteroidales bacterium]|jgi:primosomal protein N' (replication factor Y)|nr:primosomal protein N' [Bacteroidales bacterium]
MERITLFADILLPLKLERTFTYRVPYHLNDAIKIGQRVTVPFGKNKLYSGLVRRIHKEIPQVKEVKYLHAILDEYPIINEKQFQLWEWIAQYYLCAIGEVMNAALPSALKLNSETKIALDPAYDGMCENLSEKEYLIVEALELQQILTLSEAAKIVDLVKIMPLVKTMIDKGIIIPEEELQERYIPKKENFIRLSSVFHDEEQLRKLFEKLEKRAEKQLDILMSYLMINGSTTKDFQWIKQKTVVEMSRSNAAALKTLIGKKVFEIEEQTVSRLQDVKESKSPDEIILSADQQCCFDQIESEFKHKNVLLLHGVTASGKTELYIKLIQKTIRQGKQALYLLPEIALTGQIVSRLRKYFGNQVGVYHSRFNEHERVEIWNRVSGQEPNRYNLLLGARSALFLPYEDLGLVIVDEEHDTSYKQYDPAPRYLARDTAIVLAKIYEAKTLLGSGTPSLESWYNAQTGKYGFAQILTRYGGQELPQTIIADLKAEKRRKSMISHFSSILTEKIQESLLKKEQIILFHNRRGFAPRIVCETCDWSPQCKNCDVTLVYHKKKDTLRCHYCGYNTQVPTACPECGSSHIRLESYGTEKVEDELRLIFPDVIIERMDLDTTRGKNAHQNIIERFEQRKIDILVGTQMVSKGLDFDNVGLVGILNADQILSYPDFRSFERGFQTISQVSGRTGRSEKTGLVVIQTHVPQHLIVQFAVNHQFKEMYASQLTERKAFYYPPYVRLIRITLKHRDSLILNDAARFFADHLKSKLGNRVLGPEYSLINRIKNLYLKDILVKIEPALNNSVVKKQIVEANLLMLQKLEWKSIKMHADVDPY